MSVVINQSYRMQRITGQQRYATEIAARLSDRPGFTELAPTGWWARSSARVWLWIQLLLPVLAGRRLVLSMTARAPLWCRRQVLVVHDLFVLTHPEWFSRLYVLTHAPLLRAQLRGAAAVVAVSEPVAAEVATRFAGPIAVAPNAPSDVFAEGGDAELADEVLAARGLTPGGYLLTVGSMDPRKNLQFLARAYAALTEEQRAAYPLVVVGGGAAIFRSQQLNWPTGTVDAGYVSDAELRVLYRHCRAVVFPSLAEGFGLPLVEAAAAGAPSLVISDIGVFRWICGEHAIYVDPRSVSGLAAGLRTAINAPVPLSIDLDRFRWDVSAAVVGDVCEQALRPAPGAAPRPAQDADARTAQDADAQLAQGAAHV